MCSASRESVFWFCTLAAAIVAASPTHSQPALDDFTGRRIQHGNLLKASVKITTYNKHLGSFPPSLGNRYQVYSVDGADDVI